MISQVILGEVDLGTNKPTISDSIVIDCIDCDNIIKQVLDVYNFIIFRLRSGAGFKDAKIVFIARSDITELFIGTYPFELCKDEYVGNDAYLLTRAVDNKELILPPYEMSWNDYFSSVAMGMEVKPIRILAPWAQAKFLNVKEIK